MLHERTVSYRKHNLGSGLGKWPASAAFSRRQYDCLQIYHIPDSNNSFVLLSLALDLFGQIFIKIVTGGKKTEKAQSFIHAGIKRFIRGRQVK